jgi:Uma2 family endonuclease
MIMTAADLEQLYLPNKQVELVRGQLVVREPPGTWHGKVSQNLALLLGNFVKEQGRGAVFAQDTGFKIASDPDTVRGADVAYVGPDGLSRIGRRGYAAVAPDLVAEVVSPDDRPAELLAKVAEWLGAGTRVVWVIDPARSEARVYRSDGTVSVLAADGTLEGEAVLPGFRCRLHDVLA